MQKIVKIIISVVCVVLMSANNVSADTYRVISIRGCTATIGEEPVREGNIVPGGTTFSVKRINGATSWTIKLQSTSTGKIHPLCSASSSNGTTNKENSKGWLSWFWNSITGQKKCSTRAPENELTEGLSNNLSQTFYLLYPFDENENSDVDFATTLEDGSLLLCEYKIGTVTNSFEIPISNSRFTLSAKYFDGIDLSNDRATLRITVKCKSSSGEIIPITDSMNVILLKD